MGRHWFGLAMVISLVLVSVAPQANGAAGTPIVTPVGKNIARGNDDPNECNPSYLC